MKLHPIALIVAAASSHAIAQESATEQLPTLEVQASLSEVDKLVAAEGQRVGASEGAQLITDDYARAQQASTIADMLRKTTSVQVDEEGGQQGSVIMIRGLSGDQVSVRVEGAPKNFNQVRHGGANTVWLEPDMYKSVSVVPGVASNVYGNGSLGGVILLETKDAADILNGEKVAGAVRTGIETNAQSVYVSADAAVQATDKLALNTTVTRRDTKAYEDGNGDEAIGGATGTDDINVLLKANYAINEFSQVEASWVGLRKDYTTRGTQSQGTVVSDTGQYTEVDDDTYSIQYTHNDESNLLVDVNLRASVNEIEQYRLADGATDATNWGVKTYYLEGENKSLFFQDDEVIHTVRFGADYTKDEINSAYEDNDGSVVEREREQTGVYISDTVLVGESLEIVGSVRYDRFTTSSQGTELDANDAFLPKLSLSYKPFNEGALAGASIFATAGKGFRAPSVHESFGRGINEPSCGRRGCTQTLPNENLKGESSDSYELGFAYAQSGVMSPEDSLSMRVTYINNDIEDLIASEELGVVEVDGVGTVTQSSFTNIDKAYIDGFEVSVNYVSQAWFASITAQDLKGEEEDGTKLRDVSPKSINATIGAYLLDGKSRVGMDVSHRGSRDLEDPRFSRIGYTTYDLFASYQVNDSWLLQARIENATDKLYTKRYQNLSIDTDTGEAQDLTYYQPGRNVKLTVQYTF